MLVADSILIESPEELEKITEKPSIVFMSLDDDEENIGFDELEDLDDDELDDDDEFDDEEEEEEDDDEIFGDEEDDDDDLEDDDFDDDDF